MKRGFVKGLTGRACGTFCLFLLILSSCGEAAFASDATPAPTPVNVVTATTDQWSSVQSIDCDGSVPCEVRTSDCSGIVRNTQIDAGKTLFVTNAADLQCSAVAPVDTITFQVISGAPAIATHAFFKSPINLAAVYIPPVSFGSALGGRVLQNDDVYSTTFALFNHSDGPLWVTLTFYNGTDLLGHDVRLLQRGFNFVDKIDSRFTVGRVEIRRGAEFVGCQGCAPDTSIAGVAFVNWRSGGSPLAVPLQPIN